MSAVLSTPWGPSGEIVYRRSYRRARADGSPEEWPDTVERVVDGNLALVDRRHHLPDERRQLIELFLQFRALPAGRHLWSTGIRDRQHVFNCHAAGWESNDLAAHFGFVLDQLLQGGGVGTNYSNRFLRRLPAIASAPTLTLVCGDAHPDRAALDRWNVTSTPATHGERHVVADSREGWRDALVRLIRAHQLPGTQTLEFDLGGVRPKGAVIARHGGFAAGPAALAKLLRLTSDMLRVLVGSQLDSLDAMALDHLIAETAAAGGMRRAARMSIKHWADDDVFAFIDAKRHGDGQWSTNLSVEIDDDFIDLVERGHDRAVAVLRRVVDGMLTNGEPGLWNWSLANADEPSEVTTPNPCGEISLQPWESCTIGHVNLGAFEDDIDAIADAHRLMARFLLRSTFATITDARQRGVVGRNRRIGVGHFGYHAWVLGRGVRYSDSHRDPSIRSTLRHLHAVTRQAADEYAAELGVPSPVKVTTVAPTGTVAKLAGASEGIQPIYARHYLRRIRLAAGSEEATALQERGFAVEDDAVVANTVVATIPTRDTLVADVRHRWGARADGLVESADEVSLRDFLGVQAMYQECYADNGVSATAHVPEGAWTVQELAAALGAFLRRLKGTTILVEGRWVQAPYERISEAAYLSFAARTEGSGVATCGDVSTRRCGQRRS
ncbi:MAG TPA: ribonucleoside-triphosphate reductase, adenosylcobalamin-dependent [Acidimicrobiales bacterium]